MEDHHKEEEKKEESFIEKITGKISGPAHDSSSSSSSSESDDDKKEKKKEKKQKKKKDKSNRLFVRDKPLHQVLGGGTAADVFLWKDWKTAATILIGATAIWLLFEVFEYHLLPLICYSLIGGYTIFFVWAVATAFFTKSPPPIPELTIPEDSVLRAASVLRVEFNKGIEFLRDVAFERDLKKFVGVVAALWILALVGKACNLSTLIFAGTLLLFTVPVLYEKYDHKVDALAEKTMFEVKKQYAVFDEKVVSKIPKGPLEKITNVKKE